jgi:hypothetical protein
MPAVIGALLFEAAAGGFISWATAGAIGTFLTSYGSYVLLAATMAYSASEARKKEAEARDAWNAAQVDRLAMVNSSVAPRELVLGRVRKSGVVFYKASTGKNQQDLYLCIALAGHEIDAVERIYVDDQPVSWNPTTGDITTAPFSGYLNVKAYLGAPGQAASQDLIAAFPNSWTANNTVQGVAYLVVKMSYNEDVFNHGVPQISAVIRGAKVYDPRSATTAWSDNPAVLMRHIYTHPKFGKSVAGQRRNLLSWTDSMATNWRVYTEAAKTKRNLLSYTEDFSNNAWVKFNATVAANADTDPYGGTTADVVTIATSGSDRVEQYVSDIAVPGITVTFSVWLRGTGTINIAAQTSTGIGGGGEITVTLSPNWTRYQTQFTPSAGATGTYRVMIVRRAYNTASTVRAWGAQLELGSTATGYQSILTTVPLASAATVQMLTDPQYGNFVRITKTAGEDTLRAGLQWNNASGLSGNSFTASLTARTNVAGTSGSAIYVDASAPSQPSRLLTASVALPSTVNAWQALQATAQGAALAGNAATYIFVSGPVGSSADFALPQLENGLVKTPYQPIFTNTFDANSAYLNPSENARIIAAANFCDLFTIYKKNGVAERSRELYKASIVLPFGASAQSAMNDLAQAMGGSWAFSGGELFLRPGVYTAPVMSLGDTDLAVVQETDGSQSQVPIKISSHKPRADRINTIKPVIWDEEGDWKQTALSEVSSAALVTRDGSVLQQDITMPAISYGPQAAHVAGIIMRDGRDPLVVELPFKLRAYPLEIFDAVNLTLTEFGWSSKTFVIIGKTISAEGYVSLTLKETSALITTLDAMFVSNGYAANTNLPKPWEIASIGTLTVTSGTASLLLQADGTIVSRMLVTWPTVTDAAVISAGLIEIQYKRASETNWASVLVPGDNAQAYVPNVIDKEVYQLRARMKTAFTGPWSATVNHTVVGKTAPPGDVRGLAYTITQNGVQLSWTASTDLDYSETVIRSGSAWATASAVTRIAGTTHLLNWLPAGNSVFLAKHVDTTNNESTNATSVTIPIRAPSAPASLSLTFGTANIEASWTAPAVAANQQALDRVELSWSSSFAAVIDAKKSTTTTFGWLPAGTYTLYARYVDVAGNIGAVSQISQQVLPPAQVVMTAVETQINLVTLRWQDAKTSQPIRKYAIYYGDAGTPLASAALYGSAGADSRSDILQYRSSGAKVAYLVAEDVAGNLSTERQIDLTIRMPDNFVLATEYYEDWQSTEITNGTIVGGATGQIILPAFDGRTWGQRLSNNGWTTAQEKINAGYPVLIQPVPLSGKHVERKDCGKVIATSVVRVTPTVLNTSVAGYTATIRIRASIGASTTNWSPWLTGEAASFNNFQHVEVEYSVVSDGKGFVVLDDLYVRVEVIEVTETATLTLNPADAAGTVFVCTKPFLDVRGVTIGVQHPSTIFGAPRYVIDDATLPAKVYVFAHDVSNNRTGGTVTLFITGV